MKEDVLEQITADYLNTKGYFTLTNIKYRPEPTDPDWNGKQDGVHSDIDVIGYNPRKHSPHKVITVSCKSWQEGFWASFELDAIAEKKEISGRQRWKTYRELASPKWGRAFRKKTVELTRQTKFEHWIVCTKFGDPDCESDWINNKDFGNNLTPYLRIVSLRDIFSETLKSMTTTPANSELGRLIQLLKIALPNITDSI
jgi:hypothetical protein